MYFNVPASYYPEPKCMMTAITGTFIITCAKVMIAADAQLIGSLKEKSTLKLHFCRFIEIWANEKVLPAGMWLIPAEMLTQHAHTHTHTHERTRLVNEICHVKKYVQKKKPRALYSQLRASDSNALAFLCDSDFSCILEVSLLLLSCSLHQTE